LANKQLSSRDLWMLLVWASLLVPLMTWEGIAASAPVPGNSSPSVMADPKLSGPDNLCMVFGSVLGIFSGEGNPNSDVYTWVVTNPDGEEIFRRSGGVQYATIEVWFAAPGDYRVDLSVRRNADIILTETKVVGVTKGPDLVVSPDYLLCGDKPTEITAIDPASPNFDQYVFKWTDASGNVLGNTNTITASKEGYYLYELYLQGNAGQQVCLITGSTYAGPSVDFNIELNTTSLCQRQPLQASANSRISGEWFLIKPNSTTRTSVGKGYDLTLRGNDLANIGVYTLVYSVIDPKFPDCSSERQTNFQVSEGPAFSVTVKDKPDMCAGSNGSIEILARSPLDSLFVLERDYVGTNIPRNGTVTVDGLRGGVLTVVGYINGCENVLLFPLEFKNAPPNLPEITIIPEGCSDSDATLGSVEIVFPQGPVNGTYRVMGVDEGALLSGELRNESSLTIALPGGSYLLDLTLEGCIYPARRLNVPSKSPVRFEQPSRVFICENYELTPATNQDLIFTLKYPDRTEQTLPAGETFILTEPGEYELYGEAADPSSGLCPKTETFTATASTPFSFGYTYQADCFGNQVHEAYADGGSIDQASIRWLNDKGEIMFRGKTFYAPYVGEFSLIVQPRGAEYCEVEPLNFTVDALVFNTEPLLEASKLCPDPGTADVKLILDSTLTITSIKWIFFDDAGNRRDLPQFENQKEILVNTPGNYEAVVYNRVGCEMGRDFIRVDTSTLLDLPKVEERYGICTSASTSSTIDPGEYAEYFWYLEGNLISTDRQFTATKIGNYILRVVTLDGCEFSAAFETYDACDFEYAYPNAMVLGDPERNFEVTVNDGITEAELFIINRQGTIVHYEKTEETPIGLPFFEWDGKSNGTYITPGTYVVILIGRNPAYKFEEKITGSLLVIE
jgi:hypothetical protein